MPEKKPEQNLFLETLTWICHHLESLDIPYMITGGSAVGFWGHIRTTMDIDMVVEIDPKKIRPLLQEIRKEAYINIEEISVHKPLKMFNIILHKTGFKIDIIPLNGTDEYELVKFGRRKKIKYLDKHIYIIAPEDLIISKLSWNRKGGGSDRQLSDCESIYKLNHGSLDLKYMNKWIRVLGLEADFKRITA